MSSEIVQRQAQFTADAMYFNEHGQELVSRYPEQWVAVYCKEVVGVARELQELIEQLNHHGIPRGRAFVGYATDEDEILILAVARR